MSPTRRDDPERQRLAALAVRLRDATWAALCEHSLVAASLDESRTEVERLLMLETIDPADARRVVGRAQLMLDGWRNMRAAGPGGDDGSDDGRSGGGSDGRSGGGSDGRSDGGSGGSDDGVGSSGVG